MHGLENQLVIGVVGESSNALYSVQNLTNHPNVYLHEDYAATIKTAYSRINRLFGMIAALDSGKLKQPFALLHADMILTMPIELEKESGVFFQTDSDSQLTLKTNVDLPWIPMSGTMCFNNVPHEFFHAMLKQTAYLAEHLNEVKNVENLAWILSAATHKIVLRRRFYDVFMWYHEKIGNIIHYKHGLPPYFIKSNYKALSDIGFAEMPYDVLLEHNPSPNTNYMQQVVKSYLKKP